MSQVSTSGTSAPLYSAATSLQAILDAILDAGDAQIREIEEHASIQVHEILADNLLEAQLAKERAYLEASLPTARQRSRLIHMAHLEAMQIRGCARDTLVNKAFERIRERLFHYRADPNYPVVLSRLVEETLTELEGPSTGSQMGDQASTSLEQRLPGNDIYLLADRRDKNILENILTTNKLKLPPHYARELPILYDLECWGGINAQSLDGRIVSINTLDARLERATPALRRFLAAFFEPVTMIGNEPSETELTQAGEKINV